MTLAVKVQGDGPDLVLLHGWGLHSGVWSGFATLLAEHFRLHLVDLPGHGDSAFSDQNTLEDWAAAVIDVAPVGAIWVGWSLGGLVALRAALMAPIGIEKLVLLASTPKFVTSHDWSHAIEPDVLQSFAVELQDNFADTLQRFLSLQVMGSRQSGRTLRDLRSHLLKKPAADARALQAGLNILGETDFRQSLDDFPVPVYWLLGGRDRLVPPQAADTFPHIPVQVIEDAGHAPFVSNPAECADFLKAITACQLEQHSHGG